jgi:two-component system phosphate regulon response regulator PhoB
MGKLIHVVEDDDDIRFIVEYILIESGYRVESSSNVTDFYQSLETNVPDLILLDVMLPDGNGIDICRDMKEREITKDINIIIMSAHAAEKAVLEEACSDDFISKPFDLDNLLRHVKRFLPI